MTPHAGNNGARRRGTRILCPALFFCCWRLVEHWCRWVHGVSRGGEARVRGGGPDSARKSDSEEMPGPPGG